MKSLAVLCLALFLVSHSVAKEGIVNIGDIEALNRAASRLKEGLFKPQKSVRQWRKTISDPRAGLFPWEDYYAQRGRAFSGEIWIDPQTAMIRATIMVEGIIIGDGHNSQYFLTFLPVTQVTDDQGNPVPFEETYYMGVKLTKILLSEPSKDQAPFAYVFTMEGTPDCQYAGTFDVNLCAFGDITYLALDIVLPGSLMGDFATLDLKVTVPQGLVVSSSGITVSIEPSALPGYEVHHVVQPFPTDAHTMALSKYQVSMVPFAEEKWVGSFTTPVPIIAQIVPTVLKDMRDVLTFYSERFGDFLFPKMEAAQVTDDAGAAFGWPALLWVPTMMFLMGTGGGPGWGESERTALFAHELGHQWFPDMLKNNDAWAAWLSEGFAEFLSIYFMASLEGESYLQGTFESYGILYRYFVPQNKDYGLTSKESQWVSDALIYQIVTYYKGAAVVNMLRQVLGEPTFLDAMKKLYEDYAGKEAWYDTATLKTYLETAYGSPLDWLFDPWVYGKGYPIYVVDVERLQPQADGKGRIRVSITSRWSTGSAAYPLPITFSIVTDKGEETHTEWIDASEKMFEWSHDGRFVRLRIDPERSYIKRVSAALDGDMDLSGEVDGIDLLYVAWAQGGKIGQTYNFLSYVDFDANGLVEKSELDLVMAAFGSTSEDKP